MRDNGRITLYLVRDETEWTVTNWPGTLRYRITDRHTGNHNIARTRTDVHFVDETGARWHGVQYGEWSDLCRCRRMVIR
jgi:hypothetical protein